MSEAQPTLARRDLGLRLKAHRERIGLTDKQAAELLGYNVKTIQRIEAGTHGTRRLVVESLVSHYGIPQEEASHLYGLVVRGAERGWWEPYFDIGAGQASRPRIPLFLETEQSAAQIWVLETEVIPGLLQTPEYLHVLQAAQLVMSEEVTESLQGLRTKRQELLYGRSSLPVLEFIIGKAAIDYLDAMDPEVRDGQIARILDVAAMPNVRIRVLTQLHAAAAGAFNIVYPGDATDPIVFMDAPDGCRYIEDRRIVSMFEETFGSARGKTVLVEEYLK
ncbi:helix-turn-helix transcriptional regulator [Glycomyces sp. NPDC021274]|uniref:helix-turn-helix domain-containing protein n=1 Tax=Glycomyces sp. NPDC021274 TaxID=3155120 RepID=UPI0033CF9EFA